MTKPLSILPLSLFLFLGSALAALAAEPPNFQDHVLPIFKQHCNNCHNPDKSKAGLDLTSVDAIKQGSSGGDVVRVGTPDSSVLYMVMNHEDGFEPMPPKKPKLDAKTLAVVHAWIAGGMIAAKGGKSGLREVSFDLAAGSSARPETVAVPVGIPPAVSKPAPVLAVAASPWADVFAVGGHREIRLYAPGAAAAEAADFEPVGAKDLLTRLTFDDSKTTKATRTTGRIGGGHLADRKPRPLPEGDARLNPDNGFTVAAWFLPAPAAEMKDGAYFFGHNSFKFFIEPGGPNWKLRINVRDQNNRSLYFGRVGTFRGDVWSHVALTYNGKEFVTVFNGKEVARQPVDESFKGFRPSQDPYTFGSAGHHKGYKGVIDDFRIYARALTVDELLQVTRRSTRQLGLVGALPFELGAIHQLRFSPNGDLLLAAGGRGAHSGAVQLFDVASGSLKATVGDEQDVVLAADISPDHGRVALGGPGRTIKIHATSNGAVEHRIKKHTDWVTALRFSPDGTYLASGDRNGAVHVWETETGGILFSLSEHRLAITDLAWRPDGKVLATTGEDGKLVLWSMEDGFPLRAIPAHQKKTTDRYTRLTGTIDVAYLPDGSLFTSGRDRALRLWKTDGSRRIKDIPGLASLPLAAAVTHDGSHALTGQRDGSLLLWDLFSGIPTELSTQ